MMGFWVFGCLMVMHLLADFFLQSREMGKNKSSSLMCLMQHGSIHLIVFAIGYPLCIIGYGYMLGQEAYDMVLSYSAIYFIGGAVLAAHNAVLHMIVDACTWNIYKVSVWLRRKKWIEANKTLIDGYVSRAGGIGREATNKEIRKLMAEHYKYYEDPWFYHTIGIDQFLHVLCIAFVYSKVLFGA